MLTCKVIEIIMIRNIHDCNAATEQLYHISQHTTIWFITHNNTFSNTMYEVYTKTSIHLQRRMLVML